MIYLAVIGDLIASKELADERQQVQEKMLLALSEINQVYADYIVSKFSITLGDEFQGLLKENAPIFQIIDDINRRIYPRKLRYGLGKGEILTKINPEISIGSDGPAYWRAREAIQQVHQKNDYGNTQVFVRVNDAFKDTCLNALISASEAIKSDWRNSQMELLNVLLEQGVYDERFDHQSLAERLGIQASALSKRLKSSSLKVYLRARNTALTLLQSSKKEGEQ
ncbi:SatD family protein [Streptococcus dentiloxodontae]